MNIKQVYVFTMQRLINNTGTKLMKGMVFFTMYVLLLSCSNKNETAATVGNWSKTTPFKGRPRSGAVVFTIGTKAFSGMGYDGDEYISDFYAYDVNAGFWESRKPFPGTLR